jgi:hypothetical protein
MIAGGCRVEPSLSRGFHRLPDRHACADIAKSFLIANVLLSRAAGLRPAIRWIARLAASALLLLWLLPPASAEVPGGPGGQVNPLAYACGVPIGDGGVHTIGNAPAGSCFAGIRTLRRLADVVINGATPFRFLIDDGSVTGPLATWHGRTNPFTAPDGAYRLTDASVSRIDIAWLAIQAAALGGGVYLPAGNYVVGSAMPLPIMIINHFDDFASHSGPGSLFLGEGSGRSIITAGSSFGTLADGITNIPLMSCGDPAATPANRLGRWYPNNGQCAGTLQGIMLWGDPGATAQGPATHYRTDGLALGARLATVDVISNWFYNDITFTGDHTLHTRLKANGGVFGAYWTAPNQVLTGDWQFIDFAASGQSFASLRVSGRTAINATFEGETYLNAAGYAIFGDADGCTPILYSSKFSHLMTEYLGLGVIHDEHVFEAATGVYDDRHKCRGVDGLLVDYWFNEFQNNVVPRGTPRRRRALIDAAEISGVIRGIDTAGGGIVPVADPQGPAGVASFNANRYGDYTTGIGLSLSGNLLATFAAAAHAGHDGTAVPLIAPSWDSGIAAVPAGGVTWDIPGYASGHFAVFMQQGNRAVAGLGDLLQTAYGPNAVAICCNGFNPSAAPAGIAAMANITAGQAIPVQTGGIAQVNFGWHPPGAGALTPAGGVGGAVTLAPGSGGVDGLYRFTATGGGCSSAPEGTVAVVNGAITRVTITNPGDGCTSPPTVSLPPQAAGGRVALQWPGGNARMAANAEDAPVIGITVNSRGSATDGTQVVFARLVGLQ